MNTKEKKHKVSFETEIVLTGQDIDDLIACALEGGINYWCRLVTVKDVPKRFEGKYEYASDVISLGGKLELTEDYTGKKHVLTLEKFMKGVKMTCKDHGYKSGAELINYHDAEVADCLIQYALFEEIIYG